MKAIFNWLRGERPAGAWVHPSRAIELEVPPHEAFARCVRGIEDVLGGSVREADAAAGHLEASFGLVDSERLICRVDGREGGSRVRIETRRGARPAGTLHSAYADALADYLSSSQPM